MTSQSGFFLLPSWGVPLSHSLSFYLTCRCLFSALLTGSVPWEADPQSLPHPEPLSSAPPGFCRVSPAQRLRTGSESVGTWIPCLLCAGRWQSSTPTALGRPPALDEVQPSSRYAAAPPLAPQATDSWGSSLWTARPSPGSHSPAPL